MAPAPAFGTVKDEAAVHIQPTMLLLKKLHFPQTAYAFIVRAKKQQWASSLCHSLVLYTFGGLFYCVRFIKIAPFKKA